MRAALLLVTAVAVATPAAARLQPAPAGPVVAPPEAPRPGRGGWMGPGRHRHHRVAQGAYGYGGYGGYAFAGYADEAPGGFFEDGEAVPAPGGVRYLYDRSYPYEHYHPPGVRAEPWPEPPGQSCATRWEGPVAVHSCRR
jgi:hypothetical protein